MDETNYRLERYVQYPLYDNGVFAPKGSNPKFHAEVGVFNFDCNPMHPLIQGYIMYDGQNPNQLVRQTRLNVYNIDFDKVNERGPQQA